MQSILRFVPDDAVRPLQHLGGNLLTPVRRQAVHHQGIRSCRGQQSRVHLESGEIRKPLGLFLFLPHARPHVGDDQIGIADSFGRILKQLDPRAARGYQLPVGLVPGRARDAQREIESLGCLDKGIAHIVAIAHPHDRAPGDVATMLDIGLNVGK